MTSVARQVKRKKRIVLLLRQHGLYNVRCHSEMLAGHENTVVTHNYTMIAYMIAC